MVRIHLERLPPGAHRKLHIRNAGPYKVFKKITSNGNVVDLPANSGISPIFNVEDLTLYRGHDADEKSKEHIWFASCTLPTDKIVDVLVSQIVSSRRGGYQKFLI